MISAQSRELRARVKRAVDRRDMSVAELARQVGKHHASVNMWLKGMRPLPQLDPAMAAWLKANPPPAWRRVRAKEENKASSRRIARAFVDFIGSRAGAAALLESSAGRLADYERGRALIEHQHLLAMMKVLCAPAFASLLSDPIAAE